MVSSEKLLAEYRAKEKQMEDEYFRRRRPRPPGTPMFTAPRHAARSVPPRWRIDRTMTPQARGTNHASQ